MVVVGADGTWYFLARTAATPAIVLSNLVSVWQSAVTLLYPRYNAMVARGMTPDAAGREYVHAIVEMVASQF